MNLTRAIHAKPLLSLFGAVLLFAGCQAPDSSISTTKDSAPAAALSAEIHSASLQIGPYDAPVAAGYPDSWTVLENISYWSAYDETLRAPAWVAYRLGGVPHEAGPRLNNFPTDTRTHSLVSEADFPPGYDRGHMAPSEGIGKYYSQEGQDQTFFMSNMVPQRPGLNRGPWKSVETAEYTRWALQHEIWVICGPIYAENAGDAIVPKQRYGAKLVSIPEACFKIIVSKDTAGEVQTLAFIMPQQNAAGHKPAEFLRSIREIEKRTGLDFFSSLPKAQQDALEEQAAAALWP